MTRRKRRIHRLRLNFSITILLGMIVASPAATALEQQLMGPIILSTPGGTSTGPFLGPSTGNRVAVRRGTELYVRESPGRWLLTNEDAVRRWQPLKSAGPFRLPTGEQVNDAVKIQGSWLGRVSTGVIESQDAFRTFSAKPARFGVAEVICAAVRRGATDKALAYWVATDADELSRCDETHCRAVLTAPIRSIMSFDDGVDIAGDKDGGVWRFEQGEWVRQQLASEPIMRIDGVVDGGPRFAHTGTSVFESTDHGITWSLATHPAARKTWGPGGRQAWRNAMGKLGVLDEAGERIINTDPAIPANAHLLWAGPHLVLADYDVGVISIETDNSQVRLMRYPDTGRHRLHTAIVRADMVHIVAGSPLGLYSGTAKSGWEAERLAKSLEGESGFFLAVFIVTLILFFVVLDVSLRRTRSHRDR